MAEPTEDSLKTEVKEYWNRASCDTWHAQSAKFTREYFEQIEEWRYRDQPFIHAFAQFTCYHGKRVLEVGRVGKRPTIEVPTLVLWGLRDHALGPHNLDELNHFVSNLTVVRMANAGHFVHEDEPNRVTREVVTWLQNL